jgi:glycosyltransferase involved in cell wall biosynthesis
MTIRVGIVCDLAEERWPSMDLVADMLVERLGAQGRDVEAVRLQPPFRPRLTAVPLARRARNAFTLDRFANRLIDYPRWLRARHDEFDLFHLADHSYSHLVHELPAERTVVTCHDLDTFRSVLEPSVEKRSSAFRRMTSRILAGFQSAARITCDSLATRDAILAAELLPAERLEVVPNGVHTDFSSAPDPEADRMVESGLCPPTAGTVELVHVGSTIPRKNIETLLRVFAGVRRRHSGARLVRVGGALTAEQRRLARVLGVDNEIVEAPHLRRREVAAIYRRCQLVLLPSTREGFGLPVVEAMACGAVVLASNIPVLRQTGGHAAIFCEPDRVEEWADAISVLVGERDRGAPEWHTRREVGIEHAGHFSWDAYASRMIDIYDQIAGRVPAVTEGGG